MKIRSSALSTVLVVALTLGSSPLPCWAQDAPPGGEPNPQDVQTATAAFKKGTALFQQKKFSAALTEFQKSYDTVKSPNSLLYVARCQAETGELKLAYRTFSRVMAEADARIPTEPKYVPTRDSARTEQDELSKKIGLVTVNVQNADPETRLMVGGTAVDKEEWTQAIPVDPGTVEIVVGHPTRPSVNKSVTVAAGARESVDVDATATAASEPPPPTTAPPEEDSGSMSPLVPIGAATAGVGVVGMVLFAVAGSMSSSTYDELTTLCGGEQSCPPGNATEATDLQESGRSQQTLANVGLIVGAVGLAAGATMIIIGLNSGGGDATEKASLAPRTSLAVGPGFTGVRGSF